jgi:membrane-associated phospholipid phosphatase
VSRLSRRFRPLSRIRPDRLHAALARRYPLTVGFVWVALACLVAVVWIDRPLALFLKARVEGDWKGFWTIVTDIGLGWPWYVLAVAILLRCRLAMMAAIMDETWQRWRDVARVWLVFLAVLAGSGLLVTVLKHLIGRTRPVWLFREDIYTATPLAFQSAANSFPSGHSQTIWAVMTMLMAMYPRHWPTWVALGAAVAASRLFVTVHYLSDVLMGSFIGIACAVLASRWAARRGWPLRLGKPV